MLHTIIFIGRSGCGKGTQIELLKKRLNEMDEEKRQILCVETGERFRKFIREDNYSSTLARHITESGDLQPGFLAGWMWSNVLIEELAENMHIIFDGAPRSLPEAHLLSTAMRFYSRERPTVIYLNVSRKWSEDRLLARGRSDDMTLDKINKRLDWFEKEVVPAIEYFKQNSFYRFIEIGGEQGMNKVHSDIVANYEYSV